MSVNFNLLNPNGSFNRQVEVQIKSRPDFWPLMWQNLGDIPDNAIDNFKAHVLIHFIPVWHNVFGDIEASYAEDITKMLKTASPFYQQKWAEVLREPTIGHLNEHTFKDTIKFIGGDLKIPASAWTVKCGHHLMKFTESLPADYFIESPLSRYEQFVEIGAGVGEVARMCLDFVADPRTPRSYHFIDHPSMIRFAKANCQRHAKYIHGYNDVDEMYAAETFSPKKRTLFIATWSLSEIEIEARRNIVNKMNSVNADYLIAFQNDVFGVNNHEYFNTEFISELGENKRFEFVDIPWIPFNYGNSYLFVWDKML